MGRTAIQPVENKGDSQNTREQPPAMKEYKKAPLDFSQWSTSEFAPQKIIDDGLPEAFKKALAEHPDLLPEIKLSAKEKDLIGGDEGEKMFQSFVAFVSENVEKLNKIANIRSDPTFVELNNALVQFESIQLALICLYESIRFEEAQAKEQYNHTFNGCYCQTRDKYNPTEVAATRYLSTKELEMRTDVDYYATLKPLWNNWKALEHRLSALRRLMDSWDRFAYTLGTLSKNVQTEVNAHFTTGKGQFDQ